MAIVLREYQNDLINGARNAMRSHKRILLQSPTGSGKTAILIEMMRAALLKEKRSFFCVHQDELIQQTREALQWQQLDHGIISPKFRYSNHAIQLASVQTLKNRLSRYQPPDLIVIDECHRSVSPTYKKIIKHYPESFVIGLTATPQRTDGKGLGEIYQEIVKGPEIRSLIDDGYLCDYEIFAPPLSGFDISEVKTTAGDYQKDQVEEAMNKATITGDAVQSYLKLAKGKRCVVMCSGVKHAEEVARMYKAAGVKAAAIYGNSPTRDKVLKQFQAGEIHVLTQVQLLIEGVDIPSIEVIQWLRPTQSLIVWMQGNGRGLRPHEEKPHLIILDHVENYKRHGLPDEEREWSLDGMSKKSKEKNQVLVKQCKMCWHVFKPKPACPKCGRVNDTQRGAIEVNSDVELVKIDKPEKKYTDTSTCLYLSEWEAVAKSKNYKKGWAKIRYKIRIQEIYSDLVCEKPQDRSRFYHKNVNFFYNRLVERYGLQDSEQQKIDVINHMKNDQGLGVIL